ncbi:hypothetical protein MASR1M90_01230 [Desulfovibrionales bacterium]
MMMDDETLQMYVEEATEHLGDIENDLLTIEQTGADIDEELVNKVFRAAHSIKGGAGFLGLTKIKELGHKIENVLDMVRNRELVPEPEVVNIVLLAFDKLRELIVNTAESNDMFIDDHLTALTGIASAHLRGAEKTSADRTVEIKAPSGRTVFVLSEFDVLQNRKGGKNLYLLEFDLIHDVHGKNKKPLDLLKSMDASGVILDLKVDLDAVGTLDDEGFANRIPLYVLFGSIIEEDIMPALLDLDSAFITMLHMDEPVGAPGAGQPATPASPVQAAPEEPVRQQPDKESAPLLVQAQDMPEVSASAPAAQPAPPKTTPAPLSTKTSPSVPNSGDMAQSKTDPRPGKPVIVQPDSLRVHVSLLEDLMTLAGELVLSRNQLMQAISSNALHQIEVAGQRIDLVTSELQETIMLTRMQTIGNIFNKFPRVVRDLARSLGKEMDLQLEGNDVELDKTIIEGLGDPLTHLVRNSADHGIEMPDERVAAGKQAMGTIVLKAYHEAGQVIIEIVDDGRGLDTDRIVAKALDKGLITADQAKSMSPKEKAHLIFLPGLSTAEKVTDVSGRGVGMDVVKSNLDQLGGQVDIETVRGKGTTIRIKLPLTLAIIPSLLVSVGSERYAIPQVNVDELLRIPADQIHERLEMVGDAEVLLLRGELIPLLYLSTLLGLDASSSQTSSQVSRLLRKEVDTKEGTEDIANVNLVVVSAGQFRYGLVVDQLHDSVEIVVKPLGRHFKECQGYAGATIMGDGHVALILDVAGVGRLGDLNLSAILDHAGQAGKEVEEASGKDKHSFFMFRNTPQEYCAVPLDLVARVELIHAREIEEVSGRRVIKYRGGTLPVFSLDQATNVNMLELSGELIVIVFLMAGHEIGLLANQPVDAIEVYTTIDTFTLKQPGIMGSAIIGEHTTLIVDIFELIEAVQPDWFATRGVVELPAAAHGEDVGVPHLLLVEDSDFFRNQVKKFIEDDGYTVDVAEDGAIAWNMLGADPDRYDLVVTDIEMPNMDGFELARHIRQDGRFAQMPIVALTSLAGEEDVARGKSVGIDEYQIKLDKERLLQSIYDCLQRYVS